MYFNPRSPRGLRLELPSLPSFSLFISIHAAQEGCDRYHYMLLRRSLYFNPRSPRGLRLTAAVQLARRSRFQSTQPKRAATYGESAKLGQCIQFQSTQPKRAATLQNLKAITVQQISIHAAQEGCDSKAT